MTEQLLSTRDVGSGPRDPAILGLLRPVPLTPEQVERASSFLKRVESLPTTAYGAVVAGAGPSLVEEYSRLARQSPAERKEASIDLVVKIGVVTLHNLGFRRAWNLEWTRSEMVEWECDDVGGFRKSPHWQHSYGSRFWKPKEISEEISYSGSSERHVSELRRVQKFATDQIRVPITDPHCMIHNNDNLYYYGKRLQKGEDETTSCLKGDHEAGLDFARRVTSNRVRRISETARPGEKIDIQFDNFTVTSEPREFDLPTLKKLGLNVPTYISEMKETTHSPPANIEFSQHNCLQKYEFYIGYIASELPNVTRFHYELSTHDSENLGLTAETRTGQGWDAIRLLKEHGLGRNQKVIIDVAPTYEGAKPPDPKLVRDRILYPIMTLGFEPNQIEVAPACGQRNLSLESMLAIDVNIHKGRDLALLQLQKRYGIDAEPHLTRSYLRSVRT